jgi:hypothetical protein
MQYSIFMKLTMLFICFLTFGSAYSQKPDITKLWVGDANNYLKIDSDAVGVELFYQYQDKKYASTLGYKYAVIGDTLRIIEQGSNNNTNHDYLIETLTNDQLKLNSLNNSRILAFTEVENKVLTFRSQQNVYTDTISFEKLIFSSTACYGRCPVMTFQIDNKKQMKFSGDRFAVKQGFYTAVLPDQLYTELLKVLAISDLDKLENHGNFNEDLSTYTLEVHYNNKVKFIKSAVLPFVTLQLRNLLLDLPNRVTLKEAERMEISFSE